MAATNQSCTRDSACVQIIMTNYGHFQQVAHDLFSYQLNSQCRKRARDPKQKKYLQTTKTLCLISVCIMWFMSFFLKVVF